jgi:hypothetical protein
MKVIMSELFLISIFTCSKPFERSFASKQVLSADPFKLQYSPDSPNGLRFRGFLTPINLFSLNLCQKGTRNVKKGPESGRLERCSRIVVLHRSVAYFGSAGYTLIIRKYLVLPIAFSRETFAVFC